MRVLLSTVSETSQVTSEVPTPSINTNSEDIFQMSDLEGDDDVDQVAASSKSKVSFIDKISRLLKSRSQRSLNAGQKSKSSSAVQPGSAESTVTLTPNKGYITVVSEGSRQSREFSSIMSDLKETASISEEEQVSSPTDETGPLLENVKSSRRGRVSRAMEDEAQRARVDLQKKQSSEDKQDLPRTTTLLGQDVTQELGHQNMESDHQSQSETVTFKPNNESGPKL